MVAPSPPLSVAVVEDDPPVRRALARLLSVAGFDVETFASAEEFIAALPGATPACVVLDAHLPKMGGLDLHGHLRRAGDRTGIVFITADHELAASDVMRNTGAPCLSKPLDEDALLAAISRVIGEGS
jgi:FixJ family two-component response regulator